MPPEISLFVSLFVTLLAIINPLEALPVYLGLIEGKPEDEQRGGWRSGPASTRSC